MKIAIIGYSGSGKSTLAEKLGSKYKAEVLHLDTVQFMPGWEIRPAEEQERTVSEFMASHTSWVIDGNYSKLLYERRMEEADVIIELVFARISCLYRVVRRYLTYRNRTRPDMTSGCNEKLDREFIMWVLRDGRSSGARARYRNVASKHSDKTVILKNQRQIDRYLKNLT